MKRSDNQYKYDELRKEYSTFFFDSLEVSLENGELSLRFHFRVDEEFRFAPTLKVPARDFYHWEELQEDQLQSLAFHIGMVELVSYWKIACPKKVVVRPYTLDDKQIQWWRHLYYNGLGEFFYLNGITCTESDFMQLESESERRLPKVCMPLNEHVIIPVGGGKDSVVTLECLRDEMPAIPLIVNPRGATLNCVKKAGYAEEEYMVVNRTLDPLMLQLNARGYLNGHTPFSALLAFITLLLGFGSESRYIALSNESSANESTVPDTNINHQYSKSVEFERDFRTYVSEYINPDIQYFSFLRPLSELQIAYLFSKCESYHPVFRSCNAGSKTDSWCGKCPKCLFTWIILSPFLSREQLAEIFGKDLMKDEALLPILEELNGTSAVKPFECVGTVEEVRACLDFMQDKAGTIAKNSPKGVASVEEILKRFNEEHFLPKRFETILKTMLHV